MKVLMPLNFYYRRGGDAAYSLALQDLLESRDHRVIPFSTRHPESLSSPYEHDWVSPIDFADADARRSLKDAWQVTTRSILSYEAWHKLNRLLDRESVDVAHLQNVHHHLTPSILYALRRRRIPVVWTLHDYSILCPATHFLSNGVRCESCKQVRYYQAVIKRCKRGSIGASFLAAASNSVHRALGVFRMVDRFIAPSRFLKEKFVEFGFAPERILHIPHFLDCARMTPSSEDKGYFLYVGRLSREKGPEILLRAARSYPGLDIHVVGDGPDGASLIKTYGRVAGVRFLGRKEGDGLEKAFAGARAVVVPSECYENFPMVVLEAYAYGKPVIASRLGALPEVVRDGESGLLFTPGDPEDLAAKMRRTHESRELANRLGTTGRDWLEREYGPRLHYERILAAYEEASREAAGTHAP